MSLSPLVVKHRTQGHKLTKGKVKPQLTCAVSEHLTTQGCAARGAGRREAANVLCHLPGQRQQISIYQKILIWGIFLQG